MEKVLGSIPSFSIYPSIEWVDLLLLVTRGRLLAPWRSTKEPATGRMIIDQMNSSFAYIRRNIFPPWRVMVYRFTGSISSFSIVELII